MVLVLLAAVSCVQVFLAVDRRSHSASDTLYGVFPFVVPCLMLLNWVASKTSAGGEARSETGSGRESRSGAGRPA
jgi:hypothetical protein